MKLLNKNIKLYAVLAAFGLIASCKPTIEVDEPKFNNQVNFSKYIAIGNSLTAGYADGGLYLNGQINSFPNMIAEKMKRFDGGEFITPYFSEAQRNGSGYIRLKALVNGQPVTEAVTTDLAIRGVNSAGKPLYTKYTGAEINNLGVPGMRLDMAFAEGVGTTAGNPFFERLLSDNNTTSYFTYSTTKNHTFFSFALGNNDVLGYAMNGAAASLDPTQTLISTAMFNRLYNNYINALTANGQKGVVATIPDVTAIPYFTTVTTKALLAAASAAAGTTVQAIYIQTATGVRPATDKDMFVLPFSTSGLLGKPNAQNIPYGLHSSNPVESEYVLDQAEAALIQQRIIELNNIVKSVASNKNLALADVHEFFNKVKSGYNYNGVAINNKFITGNAFSLDGIHMTPMGYAIMANIFIDGINKKYGTALEKVDATLYPVVLMP